MNAAKLNKSDRLKRVHDVLSDRREHSTLDIIREAGVCAVNSIIAELRANGQRIACERRGNVWYYRLEDNAMKEKWDPVGEAVERESERWREKGGHPLIHGTDVSEHREKLYRNLDRERLR